VAKLSTYLTGTGGAQTGNLADSVAMQRKDIFYLIKLIIFFLFLLYLRI
jgi:hypothetical protein